MTGRRAHPEQQLQRAVLNHLTWRGVPRVFAFHVPNGCWRSPIEAQVLKVQGVVAGVSDVVVIHNNRVFGRELKAEGGRLSSAQIETQQRMREAGATIATTTGIDRALTTRGMGVAAMKTLNEGAALMLMRKGQALVRMHTKYGVKWFLANGQIADDVARRIVTRADVKPVDAGLFADCAQSYRTDPDA